MAFSLRYAVTIWSIVFLGELSRAEEPPVVMANSKEQCHGQVCYRSTNVLKTIFEHAGYTVKAFAVPSKRILAALQNQHVDVALVNPSTASLFLGDSDTLVHSKYAHMFDKVMIYYRQSEAWSPSWPPKKDFKDNAKGVSKNLSLLKTFMGLNVSQINNHDAGLRMLKSKRTDYWLTTYTAGVSKIPDGIRSQGLYTFWVSAFFSNTPRGRKLEQVYTNGLVKLLQNKSKYAEVFSNNSTVEKTNMDSRLAFFILEEYHNRYPELFGGQAFSCGGTVCAEPKMAGKCCTNSVDVEFSRASIAGLCGADVTEVAGDQYLKMCFETGLGSSNSSACADQFYVLNTKEKGCCATQFSASAGHEVPVCGTQNLLYGFGCHVGAYVSRDIDDRPPGATFKTCSGDWILDE